MQEDENLTPQETPETPKKRGRKPKLEASAENVATKKRGRPRKNAEQTEEQQEAPTQERQASLDEVLDTAVKQRRATGRKSTKTNREDGPVWRDTPAVTEESPSEERENNGESESEIFVYKQKSDDFEFNRANSQDDDENSNDNSDDDDDIPTSFSTTDEDLEQDAYRNNSDDSDDDDNDDERRIAEAREYEKATDDDEQLDVRQERNNRWQNRDRNDRNNKFRDKQNGRQNNNRNQNQQQRQNNNRQQDFRNNKNRQQQNNNNRNQNQQQRQNNNRQQNQQQTRQQQKKSRWNQSQSADIEYINPADLPEWNIFKSESLINEKLAQIFFDKTPSWELESFENATPISIEEISSPKTEDVATESAEEQNVVAEEPPTTELTEEAESEVEEQKIEEEEVPQIPQKNVSDMNYWELMANANDSAVKKFGLEKGAPKEDVATENVEEQKEVATELPQAEKEKFEEPNSLVLADCGTIESLADFDELNKLGIREIQAKFDELAVEYTKGTGKSDLIAAYFKHALKNKKLVKVSGVLDVFQDGLGGAITFEADNYKLKRNSVYVPQIFIDKYGLKRGHSVSAFALPPREFGRENCPYAVAIISAMNVNPAEIKNTVPFTDLVPYYPTRRIILESPTATKNDAIPMRAVDLLTPIGFGQRALIVAPPRTGKTVLMQAMAKSIRMNAPDAHLMILLVDERPEEVTDFKRSVDAEVIASTFDEEATSHVHAAEMVISRARRMVEEGKDVIILLDSITRLARAYNALMPNGGRTMSGGVEANALQKPKKFFGSARNIENGGSLTIIGTALVETGSKMDEVIFEEFKGTGNLELHLDRALSDKRIFPAINIEKSGTRKEELLYHPDELSKIYALRRAMKDVPSTDAMEMLVQRLRKVKTNVEFLLGLNR